MATKAMYLSVTNQSLFSTTATTKNVRVRSFTVRCSTGAASTGSLATAPWKVADARLVLEDGSIWKAKSFGASGTQVGEVVFNTSLTGYQEILTDPSYAGQFVLMTCPHIGNTGVNIDDEESIKCFLAGLVIRSLSISTSNYRSTESLSDYLSKRNIMGIYDVDTRAITRRLREEGSLVGVLSTENSKTDEELLEMSRTWSIVGVDLISSVSCKEPYEWVGKTGLDWEFNTSRISGETFHVVSYDFGIKHNILRRLASYGCKITVVPSTWPASETLKMKPDGVLFSNGPGDPSAVPYAVETVKEIIGQVPIFGICMGHQLLGQALGGKTYKMKFGHHGGNHPVRNLRNGSVEISAQNHNYAVDPESLPDGVEVTHANLNDGSCAGLAFPQRKLMSLQYHPEASPGPHDSDLAYQMILDMLIPGMCNDPISGKFSDFRFLSYNQIRKCVFCKSDDLRLGSLAKLENVSQYIVLEEEAVTLLTGFSKDLNCYLRSLPFHLNPLWGHCFLERSLHFLEDVLSSLNSRELKSGRCIRMMVMGLSKGSVTPMLILEDTKKDVQKEQEEITGFGLKRLRDMVSGACGYGDRKMRVQMTDVYSLCPWEKWKSTGDQGFLMVFCRNAMKENFVYFLDGGVIVVKLVLVTEKERLCKVWHKRLGHISEAGLHELEKREVLRNKGLGKLEFCENCVLGKSTRVSFGRGQAPYKHKAVKDLSMGYMAVLLGVESMEWLRIGEADIMDYGSGTCANYEDVVDIGCVVYYLMTQRSQGCGIVHISIAVVDDMLLACKEKSRRIIQGMLLKELICGMVQYICERFNAGGSLCIDGMHRGYCVCVSMVSRSRKYVDVARFQFKMRLCQDTGKGKYMALTQKLLKESTLGLKDFIIGER
ncbi:carbamoyl-phosphate synthase small chain, chloroplastic [Tanacetum coccineum]|uniref:carbamoyl-phosphate synthase (glutamine-hydrolyzing) n=1 Tax=Tanacetum coccineum TaxID=301880 RepID=A0ABQ4ZUE4_9ASTR